MMLLALPLAITFAVAVPVTKGKGIVDPAPTRTPSVPAPIVVEPDPEASEPDAQIDPLPPIPSSSKTITFGVPQPVVGQVCTERSDGKVMLTGPADVLVAFGEERGGEHVTERTVLEVRADGKLQKLRVRFVRDTLYGSVRGYRQTMLSATRGKSYILTRKDEEGWFDATHEDGSPIDEQERQGLRGDLDHRFPGVLDGRTMTLGQKVKFNDEELHRYFAFEDSVGMKVKAHEMKLGAIEHDVARIDVKVVFDVNATNGEAGVTAYATMRSDLAQQRVTTHVEGPVHLELPGAVNGLGAPAAPGAAGPAPIVLKGTFHMEDTIICKLPKR